MVEDNILVSDPIEEASKAVTLEELEEAARSTLLPNGSYALVVGADRNAARAIVSKKDGRRYGVFNVLVSQLGAGIEAGEGKSGFVRFFLSPDIGYRSSRNGAEGELDSSSKLWSQAAKIYLQGAQPTGNTTPEAIYEWMLNNGFGIRIGEYNMENQVRAIFALRKEQRSE